MSVENPGLIRETHAAAAVNKRCLSIMLRLCKRQRVSFPPLYGFNLWIASTASCLIPFTCLRNAAIWSLVSGSLSLIGKQTYLDGSALVAILTSPQAR